MNVPEETTITKGRIDIHAVLGPYTWDNDMLPIPGGPSPRLELCGNQYEWYFAYARAIRPRAILEIGVCKGYSSVMFVSAHPLLYELHLIDNESYGFPLASAVETIGRAWDDALARLRAWNQKRIVARVIDTQLFDEFPEQRWHFDLIHVDGDHTEQGTYHDLSLAWPCLAPDGLLVLDDVDDPDHTPVRAGAQRFLGEMQPRATHVPSYRGHYLFRK